MATTPERQTSDLAAAFTSAPLSQNETACFAELGKMMVAYARAEATVHLLAYRLSGLPNVKARAVFNGMRLPDLIDLIRQMMRIGKRPDNIYQEVEDCMVQLRAIANQRHKLVHRTVKYAGSQLYVSNSLTAKSLAAAEVDVFSEHDLQNMGADCHAIRLRLMAVTTRNEDVYAEFNAFMRAPWRYKPTQRHSGKKQRRQSMK